MAYRVPGIWRTISGVIVELRTLVEREAGGTVGMRSVYQLQQQPAPVSILGLGVFGDILAALPTLRQMEGGWTEHMLC